MSRHLEYTVIDGIKCYSPEVASDYADYPDCGFALTDENADSSFWVSSRNRLFKNIVQRHLSPTGKTKFLEIGCGTGDFVRRIINNESLDITGSEIYLKGLVFAKKRLPDAEFIQFDVTKGVVGTRFQIIAAFDVIEHIEDDTAAISNMFQMLDKGGVLITSVPQHMFLWSNLDVLVKHKRRYSRGELISKLRGAGFEINYATSFIFFLFPLMLISRLFDKKNDQVQMGSEALERRVKFPWIVNKLFDLLMRLDEGLIKLGVSLPFGGTLVVVASKP